MKIFIVPPAIRNIKITDLAADSDLVFLSDPFWQGRSAIGQKNIISPDDLDLTVTSDHNYEQFKYLSRNWFQLKDVGKIFEFEGVNAGAYFFMMFAVYLPKILRATDISLELLKKYDKYELVLLHDGSIWARTFELTARSFKKQISVITVPDRRKRRDLGAYFKKIVREKIGAIYRATIGKIPTGGTLISCAGRFAEQLWDILDKDAVDYFLRPEFSLKDQKKIFGHRNKIQIATQFFCSGKDRKVARSWLRKKDIKAELDKYFTSAHFFEYRDINLWGVIKNDLSEMMDAHLEESILLIRSFNRMLDTLKPNRVLVEEDLCAFNKVLEECCMNAGIPVIQIIHGLLTFDNTASEMKSDKFIAQGEYARCFLMEAGVKSEKIYPIGAPHYAQKIATFVKDRSKVRFLNRFDIEAHSRIVTLITQPFFAEEDPYFNPDHPLTPDSLTAMIDISIEAVRNMQDVVLVIKVHHMDQNIPLVKQMIKNKDLSGKVLMVKEYDSFELAAISDLVLCGGSTVFLESLLAHTPVFIFDSLEKKYWEKLRSDYLYFEDRSNCIEKIRGILKGKIARDERLEKQETELLWHFKDKNVNSIKYFQELINEGNRETRRY